MGEYVDVKMLASRGDLQLDMGCKL